MQLIIIIAKKQNQTKTAKAAAAAATTAANNPTAWYHSLSLCKYKNHRPRKKLRTAGEAVFKELCCEITVRLDKPQPPNLQNSNSLAVY